MQTWILTALLVLSLFANGYLIAQRAAPPPPAGTDEIAPIRQLQQLMDELDVEPEWRHRLVSLGRFAAVRDDRRTAQQRLLAGELFELLADDPVEVDAASDLLRRMDVEDSVYRARLLEQFIVLLNDLSPRQRFVLLEQLRVLELGLDDLVLLGRLLP